MIATRVKDSMSHRKAVLGTCNNRAHYGWRYDTNVKNENGQLIPVPIPDEQKVIMMIKQMRNTVYKNPKFEKAKEQQHTPYAIIAQYLNTSGVPTRSKKQGKDTSEWHA
jgi:hypothetical protein